MGYKKIKKELYNVAVPLSCITVASRSVAGLRLRTAAAAWHCSTNFSGRGRTLKLPDARHDPRNAVAAQRVWASVRRSPHSSGAARMLWVRPLRGRCQSQPVSSRCASSRAGCRR